MVDPNYHAELQRLAQRVDQAAQERWRIGASRYHQTSGRPQHDETTTTDMFLASLEGNGVMEYYQFSNDEEPALGADWEWWIGSDTLGWACARIQAKRAYPGTSTGKRSPRGPVYTKLSHDVSGKSQMKLLIDGCRLGYSPDQPGASHRNLQGGVIKPYYAFYNGWPRDALDHSEDVAGIRENETRIARKASRRTDRPDWGDWAQTRLLHYASCTPHVIRRESPTHWSVWHRPDCDVPLPQFTPELLPFWGISALPARKVQHFYAQKPHPHSVTYLAASLPISNIMFDLWTSLAARNARGIPPNKLPDYANAVRLLGEPERRDEGINRLERIRASSMDPPARRDDNRGFSVPFVAVTRADSPRLLG